MSSKSEIKSLFESIEEYSIGAFMGNLNEDTLIQVEYIGWKTKAQNNYRIQIWVTECGCVFDENKAYDRIEEAILFAVEFCKNKKY